jgi:hypothetical protein
MPWPYTEVITSSLSTVLSEMQTLPRHIPLFLVNLKLENFEALIDNYCEATRGNLNEADDIVIFMFMHNA